MSSENTTRSTLQVTFKPPISCMLLQPQAARQTKARIASVMVHRYVLQGKRVSVASINLLYDYVYTSEVRQPQEYRAERSIAPLSHPHLMTPARRRIGKVVPSFSQPAPPPRREIP